MVKHKIRHAFCINLYLYNCKTRPNLMYRNFIVRNLFPNGSFFHALAFMLLLGSTNCALAQSSDYSFKSADEQVAMEVSRNAGNIDITIMFSKASEFEYVMIERSADSKTGFSQCKYIKFNESANDSVVIVKRDNYPLGAASDVFYRIKTVTKEGITRTYPSVRLPALHALKEQ